MVREVFDTVEIWDHEHVLPFALAPYSATISFAVVSRLSAAIVMTATFDFGNWLM
jgi:hypothetical protein